MTQAVNVMELERFATKDGPGIRTVVFLKGCPLHCAWCANPESQSAHAQLLFFANKCTACGACVAACKAGACSGIQGEVPHLNRALCTACGACAAVCPQQARRLSGEQRTVGQIMAEVLRDRDYYEVSGGGVTFSGGEPFAQPAELLALLRAAKQAGLSTAIETCGAFAPELVEKAAADTDLFLFDVKCADAQRLYAATGASLAQVEENLTNAAHSGTEVVGRIPVIPGFNHDAHSMRVIFQLLLRCGVRQADLLPYHTLGRNKYAALGRAYEMGDTAMLAKQELLQWQALAKEYGITAKIGG